MGAVQQNDLEHDEKAVIRTRASISAFRLARRVLKKVRAVNYLGVTITADGVSDYKLVERIKKSRKILGNLRRLGVSRMESIQRHR